MSTGLHASAREELHLPHIATATASYLHEQQQQQQQPPHQQAPGGGPIPGGIHGLPKPLSLSPRTFGMEDLRDFCGPLGSFKTGLTPRVFSTGLTPRSGFTPRFTTGFTPRINNAPDTNSFFSRNTGFSPPRQADTVTKISPTGFTPKDVSGVKMPMRFPNTFTSTPPKMEPQQQQQPQQQMPPPPMQHKSIHAPMHAPPHMQHMQQQHPGHHHGQHPHHPHPDMNQMNMPMFDYLNRPAIPSQPMMTKPQKNVTPVSDEGAEPEDLDERRRMKNRERVRKCRKRKQDRLNFLEDRTAELEKENGVLKAKLARKSAGSRAEPLNETQLKELRKKQNTTLAAYVRAYNEGAEGSFENDARAIWSDNAEIIYGSHGVSISGVNSIIANKSASAAVFSNFKIVNYSVQWKESSQEKCLVHWELDVSLQSNPPAGIPLTAPFADLATFVGTDSLTVHMISHLTFDEGKITEEIRQLNVANMADAILTKFVQGSVKASDVLRCLMNA